MRRNDHPSSRASAPPQRGGGRGIVSKPWPIAGAARSPRPGGVGDRRRRPVTRAAAKVIEPGAGGRPGAVDPLGPLAVADLADRIRKRRRAKELIDQAQHLAAQQATVSLVSGQRHRRSPRPGPRSAPGPARRPKTRPPEPPQLAGPGRPGGPYGGTRCGAVLGGLAAFPRRWVKGHWSDGQPRSRGGR